MPKKNPFENILDQIADMIEMTQKKKDQPREEEPDQSIQEQLDVLEQQVNFFRKVTEEALKSSGVDEKQLKQDISKVSSNIPVKDRRFIKRSKRLTKELQSLQSDYTKKKRMAIIQKKRKKTAGKKRIRKFKRLGGQGWIPL